MEEALLGRVWRKKTPLRSSSGLTRPAPSLNRFKHPSFDLPRWKVALEAHASPIELQQQAEWSPWKDTDGDLGDVSLEQCSSLLQVSALEGVDTYGSPDEPVELEWLQDLVEVGIEPGDVDPEAFAEACGSMFRDGDDQDASLPETQ